jgi:hypothetical protein
MNLGDRLVFSNGMIVLASLAALLLWLYDASVDSLIHLYVIGVFTAFTLSQAGMIRYWMRVRGDGWRYRATVNALGATATGVVAAVVIWTKFAQGAWLVIVAIPLIVGTCYGIRRHYRGIARRLEAGATAVVASPNPQNTPLLLVESIDAATAEALWFTRAITVGRAFRAVHVPRRTTDPGIKPRWFHFSDEHSHLEMLDPTLGGRDAILEQVWRLPRGESNFVTIVIPELLKGRSLFAQLRRPFELLLKLRLLSEPGVVVADVTVAAEDEHDPPPTNLVVRIAVSGVNAASMRAVNYAQTLAVPDTRAVHFPFTSDDAYDIQRKWREHGPDLALEMSDAPYRDIGAPLLEYLRQLTIDDSTRVVLIMPELVVQGWRRFLHNQRALYIKRLLLHERHVILVSVPYQLLR